MDAEKKYTVKALLSKIGTNQELANECGVAAIAVYRWAKSGSIPSKHLAKVLAVSERKGSEVTAEQLINAMASEPTQGAA